MDNHYISVPARLLGGAIKFVEVASHLAKRSLDEVGVHRQAQKRAADLRSELVDHMIASGVIAKNQKQAAEAMLASHAETMQLLKASVDKIVEERAARTKRAGDGEAVDADAAGLGRAGGHTKEGEYDSLTDPMVGRRTAFVKESDRPLLALIGR